MAPIKSLVQGATLLDHFPATLLPQSRYILVHHSDIRAPYQHNVTSWKRRQIEATHISGVSIVLKLLDLEHSPDVGDGITPTTGTFLLL
jgi:hypothetical protein